MSNLQQHVENSNDVISRAKMVSVFSIELVGPYYVAP